MSLLQVFNNLDAIKKQPIDGSPYFKWSEALYLKQVNAYAIPSIAQATEIMKLCKALDRIRAHFNTPITITSWLRPDAYNKLIGGAQFSHHRTGAAVDFMVMGLSSDFVRAELKKHPEITQGLSFETGIVHCHIQNDGKGIWFPPPIKHKGLMQND